MPSDIPEVSDKSPCRFSDLVDMPAFTRMLESFFRATGIPTRVMDVSGELLFQSSGENACTLFHRANPKSAKTCLDSNLAFMRDLRDGHIAGGLCRNGLMDYATPVVIEGRQLATLFLGQVLHTPPDMAFFSAQAAQFGFDEKTYLKSIAAIPVADKIRLENFMAVMVEMAQMLAASGLAKLQRAALERDFSTHVEREIQLEDILDFAPVAIGWSDDEARIECINREFTKLFGYTLDDLPDLEAAYRRLFPDELHWNAFVVPWRKAVAQARRDDSPPPDLEADITCKNGTVRRMVVRMSWVGRRRLVSFTDITALKQAEQSLKQALEFAEGVVNAIPDLLFEVDLDGTYLNVWAQDPALLATQKEMMLGHTVRNVLLPDSAEIAMSAIEEADREGVSFGKVIRIELPQGECWFEVSVSRKPGPSQTDRHFIVLSRDITLRRRAELGLAARERELRVLLKSIPDKIARYTPDARHLYMNPILERLLNKPTEHFLGTTPMESFPGDERYVEYQRRLLATAASGGCDEMEMLEPMADGTTQYHLIRFFAERDEKDAVIGVLAIGTDITMRRRAELALAAHERELRVLLENIPDQIARYTTDLRHTYVSPSLERLHGKPKEFFLGKTTTECFLDAEAGEYEQYLSAVAASGGCDEMEMPIVMADGTTQYHLIRFVAERDETGVVVSVLAIGTDITRRRMIEQRMQAQDAMLEMVARGADLTDILNAIVRQVEAEDQATHCSVLLLDAEGKRLLTGAAPDLPAFYDQAIHGIDVGMGIGFCGTTAALGQRVVVEDILTHEYWKPYAELVQKAGLRSCWSEPILDSRGKVLGAFTIYHAEPKSPQAEDIERIAFAANLAAIAIENRHSQEELELRAYTDYLTGLSNRRHFLEQAESELTRTLRYARNLSLLMFDVDHFKQVNDTYSHKVGDLVLKKLAEVCRATLRNIDIVGRIGGEEFAVLLPEAGSEHAMEAAERLRAAIAAAQVILDNGPPLHFSASFGVATLKEKSANIDMLLNQADQALYRAKRAGRDRVFMYQLDDEGR